MKRIFKSKKRTFLSMVTVILVLVILINVCASVFFSFALFKKDGWKKFEEYCFDEQLNDLSEWVSRNGEKIQIDNSEGKSLTALEIKNEHISHSYIIMCHQYGGSPYSMEEYAKHFYDLGFNIVLPYMRGHGDSAYKNISFGWEDRLDIIDWVDSVVQNDKDAKIALFGVSLGANAVTLSTSEDLPKNVRLIIADSCYTSIDELFKEYVKNETSLSSFVVSNLTSAFAKSKVGESFKNADTIKKVSDIELPIMFINGENDKVVPPLVSKKLYENCESKGVEEVIIENGIHGRNLKADKETYWASIDAFILNNIGI